MRSEIFSERFCKNTPEYITVHAFIKGKTYIYFCKFIIIIIIIIIIIKVIFVFFEEDNTINKDWV